MNGNVEQYVVYKICMYKYIVHIAWKVSMHAMQTKNYKIKHFTNNYGSHVLIVVVIGYKHEHDLAYTVHAIHRKNYLMDFSLTF